MTDPSHGIGSEPRILIVGPAWLGDMVMSQSLVKALVQRYPGAAIDMLAPPATLAVAGFMPEVHHCIEMPFRHGELKLASRRRLGLSLRDRSYQVAYVLPRTLKAAAVAYWANIPVRIGHPRRTGLGLLTEVRRIDKQSIPHQAARFVALMEPNGRVPTDVPAPALALEDRAIESSLTRLGLSRPLKPLLILAPGSGNTPTKRWLPRHFADVARVRHEQGWRIWILGAPADRELTAEVNGVSGGVCADLGGRTSLAEAIAISGLADAVVSNDTGTLHVAAALDRPTIAVFGPTDPAFTLPQSSNVKAVRLGLDCSPCFKAECPLGHFGCMRDLTPQSVLAALDDLPPAAHPF